MNNQCSCGESAPHVVARRSTADGVGVEFWHDGAITGRLGRAIPGVAIQRPKSATGILLATSVASLVAGEVELYTVEELPRLVACARKVAKNNGLPGDLRTAFHASDLPSLRLVWEVYQTDRNGTPTVQVARLDRIRWPGLVVWNECGRYNVLVERLGQGRIALETTGVSFSSQHELRAYLFANVVRS